MRIPIEAVAPKVDCGRSAAKAVVGERVPISARVYAEDRLALGCRVVCRRPGGPGPTVRMRPGAPGTDTWHAEIVPDTVGGWSFAIEAFSDPYLAWRSAVLAKVEAGYTAADLANDVATGAQLLDRAAGSVPERYRRWVGAAADGLRDGGRPLKARLSGALELAELLWEHPLRDLTTVSECYPLWVDRPRALFSAWYEMFPRSEGAQVDEQHRPVRHGTFATAARRLPQIAAMGFDVVYLPPIHPIGRTNRKGRNNALVAHEGDVGSPWAIGSSEGGHDAIHPRLGTLADFDAFVAAARAVNLEVALDLALQCSPDHPWVREHPEWFTRRPDGTIAYAENPPKKYQDVYPLDFDRDPEGIRAEVLRVVRHWIDHGVRIFRVDNPHTKPVEFWRWLIAQVHHTHPDVLFLSEAFTRPAMLEGLAKAGFSQSYTYFTWRTTSAELRSYCEELLAAADYPRPNFWPQTPDILPEHLQHSGPTMFKIRAVLAALLSPSWGVYSGYELFERVARPGTEEYLDNEKYELRPRDWAAAEATGRSLAPWLTRLNAIRREHPALHWFRNLRFHRVDNDAMLCWSKRDGADTVLVVCLLDPEAAHWGNVSLDLPSLGFDWHEQFTVRDELTGASYRWGEHNPVRLDPFDEPAHVFAVHRNG